MPIGLPVSKLIIVSVNITPPGASFLNLNTLLIVGDSDVIDVVQRIRLYSSLTAVALDFSTSSPEYAAALLYFEQSPAPQNLYIGRWAQAATRGALFCGILSAAQQVLSLFTAVSSGGFKIAVDGGAAVNVAGINLSAVTNLNGVATAINAALTGAGVGATCSFVVDSNGAHFLFKSNSTGALSAVNFLTPPTAGTDLGPLLLGRAADATAGARLIGGAAAESALQAVIALDGLTTFWYGLMFASTHVADSDHQAVSAYANASTTVNPHLYGLTTSEAAALTSTDSTSIGFLLKQAAAQNRTIVQWSSTSPYAVASLFGRLLTINPNANLSFITLMYKSEPGIVAETLNSAQSAALDANNYNYFANFSNNTAIIVNGISSGGQFIDTMYGADWVTNRLQTDAYNLLFTSPTKIPQTDAGMHQLKTAMEGSCAAAVNNGYAAPGTWNSAGFGQLAQGDFLSKGYYVFQPPISTQPQSQRAARLSVPFQIALKLAGAVHSVDMILNINP